MRFRHISGVSQNGVFKGFPDFFAAKQHRVKPFQIFTPCLYIYQYINFERRYVYEPPEIYKKVS